MHIRVRFKKANGNLCIGGARCAAPPLGTREECATLQRYMERVVTVAASRISEAYGMGEGGRWAARHGLTVADADAVARAQATTSLAEVR